APTVAPAAGAALLKCAWPKAGEAIAKAAVPATIHRVINDEIISLSLFWLEPHAGCRLFQFVAASGHALWNFDPRVRSVGAFLHNGKVQNGARRQISADESCHDEFII